MKSRHNSTPVARPRPHVAPGPVIPQPVKDAAQSIAAYQIIYTPSGWVPNRHRLGNTRERYHYFKNPDGVWHCQYHIVHNDQLEPANATVPLWQMLDQDDNILHSMD